MTLEVQKVQVPFIANKGQVDERVLFYAPTFGGTVFVEKDGEVVYALPGGKGGELKVERLKFGGVTNKGQDARVSGQRSGNGELGERACSPLKRGVGGVSNCAKQEPDHSIQKSKICNLQSEIQNPKSEIKWLAIKEEFVGGKVNEIKGEAQSVTKVSYFTGNDSKEWKDNIPTYDVVMLGEVYEGIDLRLKAYGNNVEKIFTVKPDANHEMIRIRLEGAQELTVNTAGELVAETEFGAVKFTKPVAYQEIEGKKVEIECEYVISDCGIQRTEAGSMKSGARSQNINKSFINPKLVVSEVEPSKIRSPKSEYGFKVAGYDRTEDLIIDPLLASTYLGGPYEDRGRAIAVDAEGNVFVAGETLSSEFPTTPGAYRTSRKGNTDVFVSKFNSGLTNLLASTFLGGALNHERTYSIAIDAGGNVYVAGSTYSTDFPTTRGTYDATSNGRWDIFVSKFNNGLTNLLASTFLGGNADENGYSIAIDADGNVYVTGETLSANFPTTPDAYDTSYNGGYCDVFVSKFNSGLTSLLASTFLGGYSNDHATAIAIDAGGNVYVAGSTSSTDFPTTPGAYDTTPNGGSDVFVSKFNSGLTNLLMSTFQGGSRADYGNSIAVSALGYVYVTGETLSPDFPVTTGAYDTSYHRCEDVFVSRFKVDLSVDKVNIGPSHPN